MRHREQLDARRPDLNHEALRARNHLGAMVTLPLGPGLPVRPSELVALTLVEVVVGVFTGHAREAWASVRAMFGADPALPDVVGTARCDRQGATAVTVTCTNSSRTAATGSPRSAGPTTRSW